MKFKASLIVVFMLFFIWSAINPKEYFTWILEVFPAIVILIVLILTNNNFKFTNLAYFLMLAHSIILMVGGHYTYAEVPLFDWLKEIAGQDRNNYDKVGHFAQGFIPAIVARELLIRKNVIFNKSWLNYIVVSICLAFSAFYELLEWAVAELTGDSAEAFLGTQGYIWDTQSDMLLAAIGAIVALVLLAKLHDEQLKNFN